MTAWSRITFRSADPVVDGRLRPPLAAANLAVTWRFALHGQDLDRKRGRSPPPARSSTDGIMIHLHELPKEASRTAATDKFVQIRGRRPPWLFSPGRCAACPRCSVPRWCAWPSTATRLRRPRRRASRPPRCPRAEGADTYAVLVGIFRDQIDAHLAQLARVLWRCGPAASGHGRARLPLASRPCARGRDHAAGEDRQGEFAVSSSCPPARRSRRDDPVAQRRPTGCTAPRGPSPLGLGRVARCARRSRPWREIDVALKHLRTAGIP
jgi:hypothetical protein